MKRFSEQLKKKSETIRLRASEKAELHDKIVAFMEYHPLPTAIKAKAVSTNAVDSYRTFSIPRLYWRTFASLTAVFFIVVIPALAEEAIPGDILYPVKVQVTEEIRSSLSLTSYQKVDWETTRMERRISEARLLAQAGKLTPQAEADVLVAVQTHKAAAEEEIASIRTTDQEGATLAQLTLATALGVQASVLKADESASTTINMSTVALATDLDAEKLNVTSSSDSNDVSFERLISQLEVETTRAYDLLETISKSETANVQEQKDVRRRLSDLETKIKNAIDRNTSDANQAKQDLRTSWSDLQKLISFMTDIDVRSNIEIESLVPVVMTDSEILSQEIKDYEQTVINLNRINSGLDKITDKAILDKINPSLPKINELLDFSSTTMKTDVSGARGPLSDALALTNSILGFYDFPDLYINTSTGSSSASTTSLATTTIPAVSATSSTSDMPVKEISSTTSKLKIKAPF